MVGVIVEKFIDEKLFDLGFKFKVIIELFDDNVILDVKVLSLLIWLV